MKIEMLEKTLAGYKEVCSNLEQELHMSKNLPDLGKFITSLLYFLHKKNIFL